MQFTGTKEKRRFHSTILIFGQVMAQIIDAHTHIWAYVFWASRAEDFDGNSADYNYCNRLVIMLTFYFLGHLWREKGRGHHARP